MTNWTTIDAILGPPLDTERPADSFTAQQYADRHGITRKGAEYQLNPYIRTGALCTKQIRLNGKRTNVYWIPEKPKAGKK